MLELINPTRRALRLLRAVGRLGMPGALAGPPELLPMGARVLAQGYLNRFALPLLNGWLLPRWMREQTNPDSPAFVPRSVTNLMVNQTARNWTALGIPGVSHPVESLVDRYGLLTPVPGGPSLDFWVDVDGGEPGLMAASEQSQVLQRLQGDLPVVLTAYEAQGLRVSTEAWMLPRRAGDWAAVQIVLFNIADVRLRGTFWLALRPYNPEGISPIYQVNFSGRTLQAGGRPRPITWPAPERWALSNLASGDLFKLLAGKGAPLQGETTRDDGLPRTLDDPHGFAHGALGFSFNIEPWEEAEFLAFAPVHLHARRREPANRPLFTIPSLAPNPQSSIPNPSFYSRAKAATTLEWRRLLGSGMKVQVPQRDFQASWEANRAHLLALHDGDAITPGPDLYHGYWLRDAAYMTYALSICGFVEGAAQLIRGFAGRQRRDGAFISQQGEWDGTGQVLWVTGRHLALHPDPGLQAELQPAIEKGERWIAGMLAKSPLGLMPPGISAEHLGPPDRYYWDDLWSLAGLEAARHLLPPGNRKLDASIGRLRRAIRDAWRADQSRFGGNALPAAPGRGIDLGAVGTLVAWFPLQLLPPCSPLLDASLDALKEATFHEDALIVNTGHSGWGTYLNMRVAGCRLQQGSERGWELMRWLLGRASPTYNWPEAIHPRTGGGSAGDGQHGWASAEWLMLVRALLLQESRKHLTLTPVLPEEWLQSGGEIVVESAPTLFGTITFRIESHGGGRSLRLEIEPQWRTPPEQLWWNVPGRLRSARIDGGEIPLSGQRVQLPLSACAAVVERERR